ncbi:tyrosine--tRNA ligase, partial [Striga asiatica]
INNNHHLATEPTLEDGAEIVSQDGLNKVNQRLRLSRQFVILMFAPIASLSPPPSFLDLLAVLCTSELSFAASPPPPDSAESVAGSSFALRSDFSMLFELPLQESARPDFRSGSVPAGSDSFSPVFDFSAAGSVEFDSFTDSRSLSIPSPPPPADSLIQLLDVEIVALHLPPELRHPQFPQLLQQRRGGLVAARFTIAAAGGGIRISIGGDDEAAFEVEVLGPADVRGVGEVGFGGPLPELGRDGVPRGGAVAVDGEGEDELLPGAPGRGWRVIDLRRQRVALRFVHEH